VRIEGVGDPDVVALVPTSSVRLPLAMVFAGALPALAGNPSVLIGEGALRVGDDVWIPTRWFDPRPPPFAGADPSRLASAARILRVVPQAARFLASLGAHGEEAVTGALSALRSAGTTSDTALAVGIVAALSCSQS
jgi:hypothetical protein